MQKLENEEYSICIDDYVCENIQYVNSKNNSIGIVIPDRLAKVLDDIEDKYIDFELIIGQNRVMLVYISESEYDKLTHRDISNFGILMFSNIEVHFGNKSDFAKFKLTI